MHKKFFVNILFVCSCCYSLFFVVACFLFMLIFVVSISSSIFLLLSIPTHDVCVQWDVPVEVYSLTVIATLLNVLNDDCVVCGCAEWLGNKT